MGYFMAGAACGVVGMLALWFVVDYLHYSRP
jgi:hypothetical protein